MFQRSVLPPAAGFYHEDGDSPSSKNAGKFLPDYMIMEDITRHLVHFGTLHFLICCSFIVELGFIPKPAKLCLLERDVTLATLYGCSSVVVLRHQPRGVTGQGAEVVIYTVQK